MLRTYIYDIPFKATFSFGRVYARNKRQARKLLRIIFRCRSLPPKSNVWVEAL